MILQRTILIVDITCRTISKKLLGIVVGRSIGNVNIPPAVSVLKLTGIAASNEISPLLRFRITKKDVFAKYAISNNGSTSSSFFCAASWSIFKNSGENKKERCSFWHNSLVTRSSFTFALCFVPNRESNLTCGRNTAFSASWVHSKIVLIREVFSGVLLGVTHLTDSSIVSLLRIAE